jgi:hypothetical protein
MALAKDVRYCIYDASKNASVWSRVNESGFDFVVVSADADRRAVIVRAGSRTVRLLLKDARVSTGPIDPALGAVPAGLPANQAELTAAAAEEVRQRRLQREQNALQRSGKSLPPDAWR